MIIKQDILSIFRGVFSIAVVIWHTEGYLAHYNPVFNLPGRTAVWLFFGISGYVISYGFITERYSLRFNDLKDFYINRFLRVYPLFLLISIVSLITDFLISGSSPILFSDIPSQFFAFQFNQDYKLNGVFWTLGIELHFYIIAPILVIPFLKTNTSKIPILSIFIYSLAILISFCTVKFLGWSYDSREIVGNTMHFLAGMIACKLFVGYERSMKRFWLSIVAIFILIGISNFIYHTYPRLYWMGAGIIIVDIAIVFIIIAEVSFIPTSKRLTSFFSFLGLISYGLYGWHGYWIKYFPVIGKNLFYLMIISMICAYLSYLLLQKPISNLKKYKPLKN